MELDTEHKSCRACISVDELMKRAKQFAKKSKRCEGKDALTETDLFTSRDFKHCPVDKEELGRSTWNSLHTISVYYPKKPTDFDKQTASTFMESLFKSHPCGFCAKDLRENLKEDLPELENREEFAMWMCRLHNKVDRKLGRPDFDYTKVFERWRYGWKDGSSD